MKQGLPDLDNAIASVDQHTSDNMDWPRIRHGVYLVHQRLAYTYPGPVEHLQQRLMILPPQRHGDQRLVDHRLVVTNPAAATVYTLDAFGNTEISSTVPAVESSITFEAWILVERSADAGPHYLPAQALMDERYCQPSPLTQPDDALTAIASQLMAGGRQGADLAREINTWVYQTMHYTHGVTGIHTTAAEALDLKQGVCQDYAHIMVALCRLCSLPARYVSGHLPYEGGTHAWVEVLLPSETRRDRAVVTALDPTHGRQAEINYVTIAVGSDYYDVAPTSGTYVASFSGHLSAYKQVGLAMYEYTDAVAG